MLLLGSRPKVRPEKNMTYGHTGSLILLLYCILIGTAYRSLALWSSALTPIIAAYFVLVCVFSHCPTLCSVVHFSYLTFNELEDEWYLILFCSVWLVSYNFDESLVSYLFYLFSSYFQRSTRCCLLRPGAAAKGAGRGRVPPRPLAAAVAAGHPPGHTLHPPLLSPPTLPIITYCFYKRKKRRKSNDMKEVWVMHIFYSVSDLRSFHYGTGSRSNILPKCGYVPWELNHG